MAPNFDHLLPEGVSLLPFQTVGVAVGLVERRCILGDDPGLGKTIQALTIIEAAKAFPAAVACPASLRANWAKEIAAFLPGRTVEVVGPGEAHTTTADFTVVSWPALDKWAAALASSGLRAFVIDEGHKAANASTAWTKAAKVVAVSVPAGDIVIDLTGTLMKNRADDVIAQLEIIGRLGDVAPRPRFGRNDARAQRASFKTAFCGAGGDRIALNEALHATCYISRRREEVTGLSPTVRNTVLLSLNGALDTYREAEADLVRFLYESKGEWAARAALRSVALAKLNTLRQLAGEAKIAEAIAWIDNFLATTDRSLVVFAHHRTVQAAIAAHYDCPTILGGQADVETGKAVFQAGEARVIVVSLRGGNTGHTLTAASDVLFVEKDWTSTEMDQAEDRCNRIGRTAANVFAWYLEADGTVDQRITSIVEAKRVESAAVNKGVVLTGTATTSVQMALLAQFANQSPEEVK